jgi:hypothetical protein
MLFQNTKFADTVIGQQSECQAKACFYTANEGFSPDLDKGEIPARLNRSCFSPKLPKGAGQWQQLLELKSQMENFIPLLRKIPR